MNKLFPILLVLVLTTGCAGNAVKPEAVAPLIQASVGTLLLFAPDQCDEVAPVLPDVKDSLDLADLAVESIEQSCGLVEPPPPPAPEPSSDKDKPEKPKSEFKLADEG